MIKKRLNIRMSGLGGQGAVTAAHVMAMAANRDGKFSISNPFFGAEKRMAPAESYCRIGIERIYDRGELVFPDVIEVFHPQVITMGKSYTMPFYSGVKEGGGCHHQLGPASLVRRRYQSPQGPERGLVLHCGNRARDRSRRYRALDEYVDDRFGRRYYQMRLNGSSRRRLARTIRQEVRGIRWYRLLG